MRSGHHRLQQPTRVREHPHHVLVLEAAPVVAELEDEAVVEVGIEGEWVVRLLFQPEVPVLPGTSQRPQHCCRQVVVENDHAVEQRQLGRYVAPRVDAGWRRVLETAQRQLVPPQPPEEFDHARRARCGDPERNRVEKETEHLCGTLEKPTARPCRTEHHVITTAELPKKDRPCGLDEVVRGDLMLTGQQLQYRRHVLGKLRPGRRQDLFTGAESADRVDDERGGFGQTREIGAPERLRHRNVLLGQPVDVVPVRAPLGKRGPAPDEKLVVHREQLDEHHEQRPAVHQRVMGRPDELVLVVPGAEYGEAHRWAGREVKGPASVLHEVLAQAALLHGRVQLPPVLLVQCDVDVFVYDLDRAVRMLRMEGGPQRRMPVEELSQRLLEHRLIHLLMQGEQLL